MDYLPAYCRPTAYRSFAKQLLDMHSGRGLFRAAWAIALHEHPDADLLDGETTIRRLADAARSRTRSHRYEARLAHLHDVLFDVFGLRGNDGDYYESANSYLPEVLRRRKGNPITLALVYKTAAADLGLVVHGINSPGHFLAEVEQEGLVAPTPIYIDPFYGGTLLKPNEALSRIAQATGRRVGLPASLLRRASHREWLSRMLNNLQATFAAEDRQRDVFAMQELQQLLSPSASR